MESANHQFLYTLKIIVGFEYYIELSVLIMISFYM